MIEKKKVEEEYISSSFFPIKLQIEKNENGSENKNERDKMNVGPILE